jgi:hypothetical protein
MSCSLSPGPYAPDTVRAQDTQPNGHWEEEHEESRPCRREG